MPGSRALAFASRWFDPGTVSRVFEPLIADWQREWSDAPTHRRPWIAMRWRCAFLASVIVGGPSLARASAPAPVLRRVAWRIAAFTSLAAAILLLPLLRELNPAWRAGLMALMVLPSTIVLSLPFAMIGAVDVIRREALPQYIERAVAVKLAVFSAIALALLVGWVVPLTNQAWRSAMNPTPGYAPAPGIRELTIVDLVMDPARATAHEPGTWGADRAKQVRRELNSRASLVVLPVVILWRRWRVLDLPKGHWFSTKHAALASLTTIVAYLMLRFSDRLVEQAWHLPAGSAPWVTLVLLVLMTTLRLRLARGVGPRPLEN